MLLRVRRAHVIMLPPHPPTYRATEMAVLLPLIYVTHLASAKEDWSSHVTTKCLTNSSILLNKSSTQHHCALKPLSIRDVPDQRGRSIRVVTKISRHRVTSLSEAYGINRLKPLFTSDLVTLTRISKSISQWLHSCIVGRKSIRISKLSTVTINTNIFSFFSFCQRHAREGIPGRTHKFESTHGRENGWTYLVCAGRGKL